MRGVVRVSGEGEGVLRGDEVVWVIYTTLPSEVPLYEVQVCGIRCPEVPLYHCPGVPLCSFCRAPVGRWYAWARRAAGVFVCATRLAFSKCALMINEACHDWMTEGCYCGGLRRRSTPPRAGGVTWRVGSGRPARDALVHPIAFH